MKLNDTSTTYTSTQLAKCYGLNSAKQLNKLLNENKIFYKIGKSWYPYSTIDKERYKQVVNEFGTQLRFTGKGVVEIGKILGLNIKEEELNLEGVI